jgi:membrane fusion protein, heavy metal efflux system
MNYRCLYQLSILFVLVFAVLTGCNSHSDDHAHGPSGEHQEAPHQKEDEEEPLARTEFNSRLLNFFEFKPLKPGKTSSFLIHLTDLKDGTPVKEADVTLQLRGKNGKTLETIQAKVGRVTGIYVAEVTVAEAGTYGVDFLVKNEKLDETMVLEGFEVSDSPPETESEPETTAVTVPFLMEQQWLIDMKLAEVKQKELAQPIHTTGRIVPETNSHAVVSSPVAGTLTGQYLPRVGAQVVQGQSLAALQETATASDAAQVHAAMAQVESARIQTSAQLKSQNAEIKNNNARARIENARLEAEKKALIEEVTIAQAQLNQAKKDAERARKVYASEGIAAKELQAYELLLQEAQAKFRTSVVRNTALSGAPRLPINPLISDSVAELNSGLHLNGALTLRAPFSGVVTKLHRSLGEQVSAGEGILELANLRTVWLECPVFEKDLGQLSQGMEAAFTVLSYPNKEFMGTLLSIGSVIDEKTRAASVLFEVPNNDEALKLGMQADVRLASSTTLTATIVPKEAVLDRDGKKIVYVLVTGEEFERRNVSVTEDFGSSIGISSGLSPGERVVTQGAYQLFLQETNPADPGVHSHET